MRNLEEYLQIGVVTTTHGLKGEVKVYPTTDDPERFYDLETVWFDKAHEKHPLILERVRIAKGVVIVKFKEFDKIEEVEFLRGKELYVSRDNAVELQEDEYFITDLIGMEVVSEDGESIGILKDVMLTAANDVYVVDLPDGKEVLIPAIVSCIKDVDVNEGVMRVALLPGLLEG